MQAAQGFGRRGPVQIAPAVVRRDVSPARIPPQTDAPLDDETLTAFQAAARADWTAARKQRLATPIWKRRPGMTAVAVMALVFLLITLLPLHLSLSALRWAQGALGVSSLFGFGAKRLFRRKSGETNSAP